MFTVNDALNQVTSYTDVNSNIIQYEYDVVGNLTTLTYPNVKRVLYEYNAIMKVDGKIQNILKK